MGIIEIEENEIVELPHLLYLFSEFYHDFFKDGNPYAHLPINAVHECVIEFMESKNMNWKDSYVVIKTETK